MVIHRLIRYLKQTGSLEPCPGAGRNRQYSDNGIIDNLAYFSMNLHASVREATKVTNISRSTIWKTLRENKWHPYYIYGT